MWSSWATAAPAIQKSHRVDPKIAGAKSVFLKVIAATQEAETVMPSSTTSPIPVVDYGPIR